MHLHKFWNWLSFPLPNVYRKAHRNNQLTVHRVDVNFDVCLIEYELIIYIRIGQYVAPRKRK